MRWTTSLKEWQKGVDSSDTSTVAVAVAVEPMIDHSRIGRLPLQTVTRLPRVIEYRLIR